ncbi:cyclin-dependent kinase G-2 isoform X2 [Malania oleifera]|uniref:cyclin-dependent kinase G-2 isoform X2 n=1 Tax=Malania oleifera TaxID=397392 RepID=UPI0025ADB760|nr:cyclin-dependent kinase G-2 isoform X2 [Malania oleifera]
MAAGRHGGYRDNEFKDRESDLSRREFAFSKEEYSLRRNGNRDQERDTREKDRVRIRQKDIKEREVVNGGYRSTSSRSNSGSSGGSGGGHSSRRGFSVRAVDREPGELSSDSESDYTIDSESLVKDNNEVSKLENDTRSPLNNRKRKFSPIVWDREDKEVSHAYKSNVGMPNETLPPPLLPKAHRPSPNLIPNGVVQSSPIENSQLQISQASPVKPAVAMGSHGDGLPESPVGSSSPQQQQQQQHWGNDQEADQLEDEYYVPTTRNISASRWADESNSPADEGEISDDEQIPKRGKKILLSESSDARLNRRPLSPEIRELKRDGSDGTRAKSSDSDEGGIHGDDYPDNDFDKSDYMEIDEECDTNGNSANQSDTDCEDESNSRDTPEPVVPQRSVNMLQGCRSVDEFERLNKIDEGTYGVVYRAKDKKTGEIVALKKVKMEKEREGFPLTSLREINILLSFHNPSIVDVKEVVVGSSIDSIFMVMEYMEHDLKGLMETMKQPFSQSEVKCLMLQLLEGVKYLHDNWVLHRDLKTSNLLLNNRGELKICDFGLSRQYGSPLKPYTHLVVTLWYRAPELLLGAKQYSTAIDMWSLGCIMAELLSKQPLFNGKTEFDQLDKIFRTLGTPSETIWPGFSKLPGVKVNFVKHQYNLLRKKFPATSFTGSPVLSDSGFDLLNKLLTYDPEKRITAEAALNHEWFREVPLPKSKDFMPTFPAQHAQDRRMRRIMKSPDPLEEQRRKELQQGELGTGGLFG